MDSKLAEVVLTPPSARRGPLSHLEDRPFDVAIVGLGTAGAAAAALCAQGGLRVVGFDRRPLDQTGARWVNGVPAWAFQEAGFAPPSGPELRGSGHAFHLVAGWGPERVVIEDTGVLEVDMRHLVSRLQGHARQAGAHLMGEVRVEARSDEGLQTSDGQVRARWIVDASGHGGAGLVQGPTVARESLCAAAQEVRAVQDPEGASAFFRQHGVAQGETLCFSGVAGGYSILNVRLDGDHVSLLTGTLPASGHVSGKALLDGFVAEHPWIGERAFGGSRAIPLRRPADRLVSGGVALLGDAACQVFTAHGSGIGSGMVAARVLADALVSGAGLEAYGVGWMRRWGGLHAAYDVFRRLSETLTVDDVRTSMGTGLLAPATTRDAMAQRWPSPGPVAAASAVLGALRAPRLGRRFAGAIAKMMRLRGLYARYPSDPGRVDTWSRRVNRYVPES